VAALLAQAGFTGPERVFEGRQGFYQAFAGGHDPARLEAVLGTVGREWELSRLTFKPYPCGSIAHPYMDCALRLRERAGVRARDVAAIRCRTAEGPVPRLWEPLADKRRPPNGYAAKFSLPYLVAVVLVKGRAGLAEFTDAAVADPDVLALAGKVGYELDPTIDYPRQFVGHVAATLVDGRTVAETLDHPRGGPDFPMSPEELEAKFRGNAAAALPSDRVSRAVARVSDLDAAPDVTGLMAAIGGV
jgi:2-methylcitrate dehydratase PrpD